VTLRQPILYAEMMWRNQRIWVLVLSVAGIVLSAFTYLSGRDRSGATFAVFLLYTACGLLFGGVLLLYRRRNHAEVTDRGLVVSNLLRSAVIGYDLIRSTRVQKLEMHFQDARRRQVPPVARPLLTQNALFVRLRPDEVQLAELRRRLGSRLVNADMVALPVPDPDALAWEVTSRLPERTGANLGGQRRRKRPR